MTSNEKVKEGDFLLIRLDQHSPVLTEVKVMKRVGDQILKVTVLYSSDDDVYVQVDATEIFTDEGVEL